MTSTPPSLARRAPAARAAELLAPPLTTLPVPSVTLPPADHPLPLLLLRRARARGTGVWVGRTSRRSRSPSAGGRRSLKTRRQLEKPAKLEMKSRTPLTSWPVGSISSAHRAASSQRPDLRSMVRRARVAANARGKGSRSSRDLANATGSATSLISKMRSSLSIKRTTRWWWSLARTHPAVSPRSANFFSAATSESSRA
jgi:hypothetical protein